MWNKPFYQMGFHSKQSSDWNEPAFIQNSDVNIHVNMYSKIHAMYFWNSLNHKTSFSTLTIFKLAHPSKKIVHPCIDFIWISTDIQYSAKMGSKANQHRISISIEMLLLVYHFDSSKTYSYVYPFSILPLIPEWLTPFFTPFVWRHTHQTFSITM